MVLATTFRSFNEFQEILGKVLSVKNLEALILGCEDPALFHVAAITIKNKGLFNKVILFEFSGQENFIEKIERIKNLLNVSEIKFV